MEDVARQARVSKGTPYLYFPSKEALFVALHDEWGCALSARIHVAVEALPEAERRSPRQVLRTVANAVGVHVMEQPETCRVLMEARTLAAFHPAIAAAVRDHDAQMRQPLEDLVRAGVAAGDWPARTDAIMCARLFIAGMYGLMADWHLTPGSFNWDDAAEALARGVCA